MDNAHRTARGLMIALIILYVVANLLTLTRFPVMHSDESWLSGLSRQMALTGNPAATEPCFDLKPRNPQALRLIFHGLQIVFMNLFGYSLFSVRLLSLGAGLAALYFLYRLGRMIFPIRTWALVPCLLLGLDAQFIHAAHFGRQEILLLLVMIYGLYYLFRNLHPHRLRHDLILGALASLSLGIHPNGLIIGLVLAGIYLTFLTARDADSTQPPLKFRDLLAFGAAWAVGMGLLIAASYQLDPEFLPNYLSHGARQFHVLDPLPVRLERLAEFYRNLWLHKGGTYLLPRLELELILFGLVSLASLAYLIKPGSPDRPQWAWPVAAIVAVNAALLGIGRFNATSVIFLFPLFYLLAARWLMRCPAVARKWVLLILASAILGNTAGNIAPYLRYDYSSYLRRIGAAVGPDRKVLASVNADFGFHCGKLLDLRNLSYLRKHGLTVSGYVETRGIEYLIIPEGLDFIYRTRPLWNGVFGQPFYYPELRRFLNERCRPVARFAAPGFGVEIGEYVGRRNWRVTIYRVRPGAPNKKAQSNGSSQP
jgi:hypothetical protein